MTKRSQLRSRTGECERPRRLVYAHRRHGLASGPRRRDRAVVRHPDADDGTAATPCLTRGESLTAMSCARPCVAYRVETMAQTDQRALFDGVEVVDETPRHALLCVIGGKRVWVTLGNRRRGTEVQKRGDRGTLVLSKAFAIRNGLWENVSTLPAMNLRRPLSPVSLSPASPAPVPPEKVLDSGHRFGRRR